MKKFIDFLKKHLSFIGITLFVFILFKSNLGEILKNIKNVNFSYLILAAALALPMFLNKAWCWNYIKRKQGIKYNLKDSFLMYCSGIYVGILTPGRMGELTKALYLKRDGYSMGRSLVSVVLDRISDFVSLLTFILLGSLFFITVFQKQILTLILGIIIFIILFVIFLKTGLIRWSLKKLFYIFVPEKYQKSWKINFQDFVDDFKIYKFKNYLVILIISIFSWFFYYLQTYILSKAINIDVPFLYLAITVTTAGLITLIPISFAGIGTRDAALILLLAPFSVLKEQAILFSALILLMSLFAALIGLICWLYKPIRFSKNNN
jgi:uncharacterized protein (TIRG00374 family)